MNKNWFLSVFFLASITVIAQMPHQPDAAEIYQSIKKLKENGRVLYLAAHPDDENTRFIGYSVNEKLYETAYMSLTRGDGGQNLIGPEIREELGIIRTQELLAARRTDGGTQFFSRANDFGYSKNPEETYEIWDKEKVLADVVYVIRKFKPHIIVCRFPPNSKAGHGHHTASAQLGIEAFKLANDKKSYPEQLNTVSMWQPIRIVTNTGRWWNDNISADDPGVVAEDIGGYNPVMGTSYNELAARSRTMHKSQGFGSTGRRGSQLEYFEHLEGKEAKTSLFEGMPVHAPYAPAVDAILKNFDFENPSKAVAGLLELRRGFLQKNESQDVHLAREIAHIIQDCMGLYVEATSKNYYATPGDSIHVDFEVVNRSNMVVQLVSITPEHLGESEKLIRKPIENNQKITKEKSYKIPKTKSISQPYWLKKPGTLGMYNVTDQRIIGTPENKPAIVFDFVINVMGENLNFEESLVYKWNDPVKGELYRPFFIAPAFTVNFEEDLKIYPDNGAQKTTIIVKRWSKAAKGRLKWRVPTGWEVSPAGLDFNIEKLGGEEIITATVTPSTTAQSASLSAYIDFNGSKYENEFTEIEYDHIPTQVYFPKAALKLSKIDLKKTEGTIGYIVGAGDKVPDNLRTVGYQVELLDEAAILSKDLSKYQAILVGIRAFNTNPRVDFFLPKLMEYCKKGGNLVIQYNTSHRLKTKNIGPYPLKLSRKRVTDEKSAVKFLAPEHAVLNRPNKITQDDFKNWVQERGLYFPNEWSSEYTPILQWNDKGEEPLDGALIIAPYGEGNYVYTGISFFRELPVGVPGAYRLLANIIGL